MWEQAAALQMNSSMVANENNCLIRDRSHLGSHISSGLCSHWHPGTAVTPGACGAARPRSGGAAQDQAGATRSTWANGKAKEAQEPTGIKRAGKAQLHD